MFILEINNNHYSKAKVYRYNALLVYSITYRRVHEWKPRRNKVFDKNEQYLRTYLKISRWFSRKNNKFQCCHVGIRCTAWTRGRIRQTVRIGARKKISDIKLTFAWSRFKKKKKKHICKMRRTVRIAWYVRILNQTNKNITTPYITFIRETPGKKIARKIILHY
jgi:hypothetical protein